MPKPLPPVRAVPWPTLIAWRVWGWLTWPWQVRQLKAAGFRRVGWMTWEAGGCQATTGTLIVIDGRQDWPCEATGPHEWHERTTPPVAARWRDLGGGGRQVTRLNTIEEPQP